MDKIHDFKAYSFSGKDTWKGLLGSVGKVWKDKETDLEFKYRVNSFDAQVSFLDGKDKGTYSGLQNWGFYDIEGGQITFSDRRCIKCKDGSILKMAVEQSCYINSDETIKHAHLPQLHEW